MTERTEHYDEKLMEHILDDWVRCNSVCDLARPSKIQDLHGMSKVDYYMQILPGANYVRQQILNYIFSNGITTGSINEDEVLEDFLYATNMHGATNYSVLRNTIGTSISHGSAGLRWYDGNIYKYDPGTYSALTHRVDGIEEVVAFVVHEKGEKVNRIDTREWTSQMEYDDIVRNLQEQGLILLDPTEFCNIRNDTSMDYGYSPLLQDELRLDLLVAVYERLNYDIRYDGPGRLIIRPKEGYLNGEENDISTASVMNKSFESTRKRAEALKAEVARVAREIKESGSDNIIVLSNAFDEKIEHLERVTKATEFFNWIKDDTLVLAQDLGMSPSLLEVGGISGNVSMTSIIDNAMLNDIIPKRELYAIQFSPFLASHLDISKAYFNKYELAQTEDENNMRTKIVNIMSLLNAMRVKEGENDEIQPKAQQLFDDFADMLSENIHNENHQLEEL